MVYDLATSILRHWYLNVSRLVTLPLRTVEAGTYLYPFYGIFYFIRNPDLWAFYMTILVPQLVLTLAVYLIVFFTCYPLEATILFFMSGPPGLFYAWIAVLQQSSVVSIFLVKTILLPEIQRVAFDAVLTREYADNVVLLGKLRRVVKVPYYIQFMDHLWYLPTVLVIPYSIMKTIVLFGVSSLPIVGPIVAVLLQAPSAGLRNHSRYFVLKGFDFRQVSAIYKANSGAYMGFGIASTLLEQIPILSIFFMFTNTIGASLWAVSIEHKLLQSPPKPVNPGKFFLPKSPPLGQIGELLENSATEVHIDGN